MHDLVIKSATVVDGTGAPRRHADVAIDSGRITEIGDIDGSSRRTVDAEGCVLAPGFIDVHTHLDVQGFWDTTLSPTPLHGITTALAGNCGFSVAPLDEATADYLMRMLSRVEEIPVEALSTAVPWTWRSTEDFLDQIDGTLAINTGYMVGHSALRAAVMGMDARERAAEPAEIAQMVALLEHGLRAGGLGFSSSYSITHTDGEDQPVPSRSASADEFVALAAACGRFTGTSLEMIIGPPGPLDQAKVELMVEMSRAAHRPLNWNVMFPSAANVTVCLENLELGAAAAARGARIVGLAMPPQVFKPFRFHTLEQLPGMVALLSLPDDELLAMLSDPAGRARFEDATGHGHEYQRRVTEWHNYRVLETVDPGNKQYVGRLIGDIAMRESRRPFDVLCDVVVADRFRTVFENQQPAPTDADWQALVEVWTSPGALLGGSDAGAHLGKLALFNYTTTFLEHAVRRLGLVGLEQAVQLLSAKPAELYGLIDRGTIEVGAIADLVIFDETAIGAEPVRFVDDLPGGSSRLVGGARGIDHVFVGGDTIVCDGDFTEGRPGRVLRSGVDTRTPAMPTAGGSGGPP